MEVGRSFISTTVGSLIKHKIIANSSACKRYAAIVIYVSPNRRESYKNSGVIHLGIIISDHAIVFMTGKIHHDRNCPRTVEMRQFKHFQKSKFLSDLEQMPWSNVDLCFDPSDMWQEWKQVFVSCMDKNAPRKIKRISKKRVSWITKGLLHKMHRRDLTKKKVISSNDHDMCEQFKCVRDQTNN